MIKRFYNDSVPKKTALFSLLLLCACALAFLFAPTKAYAEESLGPYKGYDESQGVVITDVNGNVLTSESTIDINLIQQGVWVYRPMWYGNINLDVGGHMAYEGTPDTPLGYRGESLGAGFSGNIWSNPAPFHGYYAIHFHLKVLKANTTYTLNSQGTSSNWLGNGPYPEANGHIFYQTTITFTTGGTRNSTIGTGEGNDGGSTPGSETGSENTSGTGQDGTGTGDTNQTADTGNNPQTGSSSNSTNSSNAGANIAPRASAEDSPYSSAHLRNANNASFLENDNSTTEGTSEGNGSDFITASTGRSTGQSNISGTTLASMGSIHRIGEPATAALAGTEEMQEMASQTLSMMFSGLPYLYMLFMGILIAALPLGLLKRVLATHFKQGAATRIA